VPDQRQSSGRDRVVAAAAELEEAEAVAERIGYRGEAAPAVIADVFAASAGVSGARQPGVKRAWVEFLGEPPGAGADRVDPVTP
jgi:hypothetical protein